MSTEAVPVEKQLNKKKRKIQNVGDEKNVKKVRFRRKTESRHIIPRKLRFVDPAYDDFKVCFYTCVLFFEAILQYLSITVFLGD
jgi:hypothetical protein